MRRIIHANGLSIFLTLFFLIFLLGQILSGRLQNNEERQQHGLAPLSLSEYLGTAHFLEATMENWESEFLQMGVYVIMTAFLFQKGSSESKDPNESGPVDRDPRRAKDKESAPWPVKRGGLILKLYENSLTLAFLVLFLISFFLHAVGGRGEYNEEQIVHGQEPVALLEFMTTSRFWFESFQNWQSEFLAIACMVVFSIFLRQRGSPESKPVDSPHSQTGTD
ncbi:MAG: hypothetical protein M3Q89_07350 [Verrucomicrobiota bacterium]|nr:hypothetical protein [Verrucomicrobiota bacterium]